MDKFNTGEIVYLKLKNYEKNIKKLRDNYYEVIVSHKIRVKVPDFSDKIPKTMWAVYYKDNIQRKIIVLEENLFKRELVNIKLI